MGKRANLSEFGYMALRYEFQDSVSYHLCRIAVDVKNTVGKPNSMASPFSSFN